jgi:hypothetical protein
MLCITSVVRWVLMAVETRRNLAMTALLVADGRAWLDGVIA